jgi:preprotein translocase subunit Sec63
MVGALSLRFHGGVEARGAAQGIDLARVREKLDQVRRADYFAILGLSRHATPYEVREAAARLAAEFDPGRYAAYREPGLREQLDEILGVVAEAREVLSDDELRAEYLAGLGE